MGSSYININIHIIFHIKSTSCLIKEENLPEVYRYIGGLIRTLSGYAYMVGGMPDHIHILTSIPVTTSLSDFVRAVKANTSRWIKGLDSAYINFAWQDGYGAFSVSESNKDSVINYITNQRLHHQTRSSHDEFVQFLEKNGLKVNSYKGTSNKSTER